MRPVYSRALRMNFWGWVPCAPPQTRAIDSCRELVACFSIPGERRLATQWLSSTQPRPVVALRPQPTQLSSVQALRAYTGRASPASNSLLPPEFNTMISFTGIVKRVRHQSEESAWGSAVVEVPDASHWAQLKPYLLYPRLPKMDGSTEQARFARKHHNQSIKAQCLAVVGDTVGSVGIGSECVFEGSWTLDRFQALQFKATRLQVAATTSAIALKYKLQQLEGVGVKLADLVLQALGPARCEAVLSSTDAVAIMLEAKVPGLGKAKASAVKKEWDLKYGDLRDQGKEVFLTTAGLSSFMYQAARSRFGEGECSRLLEADPYRTLLSLPGFTLKMADEAARNLGIDQPNPISVGAAVMLEALCERATAGNHTFLQWSSLQEETRKKLDERARHNLPGVAPLPPAAPLGAQGEDGEPGVGLAAQVLGYNPTMGDLCKFATVLREQRVATFQWVNKDGQLRTLYPDLQMVRDVSTDAFPAPAYVNDIADPDVAAAGGQPGSGAGADKTFNWPYHTLVYLKPLFDAEREVGWSAARIMRHSHQQAHVWRSYVFQAAEHWAQMTTAGTAPVAFAASGEPLGQGVPASIAVPDDASHMGNMHLMQTFNTFVPELNLKQQEAVKMAAFAPLMLLTGAAGCGKTYATKAIVHLWRQQGKTVMLCAPTGRAAQRLQEMVGGQGGTACEAKTVHRLLGYQPRQGKAQDPQGGGAGGEVPGTQQQQQQPQSGGAGSTVTGGTGAKAGGEGVVAAVPLSASKVAGGLELLDQGVFKFNVNNKLPAHAVLVDEASMLDVQLAAALVAALPHDCQLMLVGDPNQLPPVGPGAVMQDVIEARVFPQVHLNEIFRQQSASAIVEGAHEIMHGQTPTRIPTLSPPDMDTLLTTLVSERPPAPPTPPPPTPYKPGGARQRAQGAAFSSIASPGSSSGAAAGASAAAIARLQSLMKGNAVVVEMAAECGVEAVAQQVCRIVQQLVQAGINVSSDVQVLSPSAKTGAGIHELNRLLQPIMNPLWARHQAAAGGALVLSAHPSGHHFTASQHFKAADRVVQVENNYDSEVFNGDLGVVRFADESKKIYTVEFPPRVGKQDPHVVKYEKQELRQLQLAWATTVHKAQGGEYPVVVLPLHHAMPRPLLLRQLLYTAVTRAKQALVLVATPQALSIAASQRERPRNSLLTARLMEGLQGGDPALAPPGPLPFPPSARPPRPANPGHSRGGRLRHSTQPGPGPGPLSAAGGAEAVAGPRVRRVAERGSGVVAGPVGGQGAEQAAGAGPDFGAGAGGEGLEAAGMAPQEGVKGGLAGDSSSTPQAVPPPLAASPSTNSSSLQEARGRVHGKGLRRAHGPAWANLGVGGGGQLMPVAGGARAAAGEGAGARAGAGAGAGAGVGAETAAKVGEAGAGVQGAASAGRAAVAAVGNGAGSGAAAGAGVRDGARARNGVESWQQQHEQRLEPEEPSSGHSNGSTSNSSNGSTNNSSNGSTNNSSNGSLSSSSNGSSSDGSRSSNGSRSSHDSSNGWTNASQPPSQVSNGVVGSDQGAGADATSMGKGTTATLRSRKPRPRGVLGGPPWVPLASLASANVSAARETSPAPGLPESQSASVTLTANPPLNGQDGPRTAVLGQGQVSPALQLNQEPVVQDAASARQDMHPPTPALMPNSSQGAPAAVQAQPLHLWGVIGSRQPTLTKNKT